MEYKYKSLEHPEITKAIAGFEDAYQSLTGQSVVVLGSLNVEKVTKVGYPVLHDRESDLCWQLWLHQAEQHNFEVRCRMFEQQCYGLYVAQTCGWDAPDGLFKDAAQAAGLTFDEWEYVKTLGVGYLSDKSFKEIEDYIAEQGYVPGTWVDVNERTPGAGTTVLAFSRLGGQEILTSDGKDLPDDVTHWMPLPKVPNS